MTVYDGDGRKKSVAFDECDVSHLILHRSEIM